MISFLETKVGTIIISIILGLGLSTLLKLVRVADVL